MCNLLSLHSDESENDTPSYVLIRTLKRVPIGPGFKNEYKYHTENHNCKKWQTRPRIEKFEDKFLGYLLAEVP